MDVFQILGDMTHLVTILGLLGYIWKTKCTAGISGRTQIMFCLVFTARYMDLFISYVSAYNSVMKILFTAGTYVTAMTIYFKIKDAEREIFDTFRCDVLVLGAGIIALFVHWDFTVIEVMWAFSQYLEAVAIIPQLYMVSKSGKSKKVVDCYIYGLAQYRCLYLVHWLNRYYGTVHIDLHSIVPGIIQVLIYYDYFFSLFSNLIVENYRKCASCDPGMRDPIYFISSRDIPSKKPRPDQAAVDVSSERLSLLEPTNEEVQNPYMPAYSVTVDAEALNTHTGTNDYPAENSRTLNSANNLADEVSYPEQPPPVDPPSYAESQNLINIVSSDSTVPQEAHCTTRNPSHV